MANYKSGGGGFFDDEHDPTSGAQPAGASSEDGKRNMVSVSLSQVANLTRKDEGLVIHRQRVFNLTTVALVKSVEDVTTKTNYVVDDYSNGSPLKVQYWKNEGDENTQAVYQPTIMEGTYVRIFGHARHDPEHGPYIVAVRMTPITDPNEIITHHLEVIRDSMVMERRKNETIHGGVKSEGMSTNGARSAGDDSQANASNLLNRGMDQLQAMVMKVITDESKDDPAGVHRNRIYEAIKSASKDQIRKAIDFLSQEGHIFSTTDDDTFRSTDC